MAEHPLLLNSKFYDLDVKEENDLIAARQSSIISGFYRGATTDAEIIDNIVPIGPYTGGDEQLAHNQRSNIYYWKIPYQKKLWINGASGSAFWRVIEKNNQTDISLGGTIVCLSPNKEKIHATSAIYLYQTFLPELKKACSEQLKS
jgi:hypothetical protein